MDPATKENLKFITIIVGAFLLLKDIPIGDFVTLAANTCGL